LERLLLLRLPRRLEPRDRLRLRLRLREREESESELLFESELSLEPELLSLSLLLLESRLLRLCFLLADLELRLLFLLLFAFLSFLAFRFFLLSFASASSFAAASFAPGFCMAFCFLTSASFCSLSRLSSSRYRAACASSASSPAKAAKASLCLLAKASNVRRGAALGRINSRTRASTCDWLAFANSFGSRAAMTQRIHKPTRRERQRGKGASSEGRLRVVAESQSDGVSCVLAFVSRVRSGFAAAWRCVLRPADQTDSRAAGAEPATATGQRDHHASKTRL
jgi:hypothetical protein